MASLLARQSIQGSSVPALGTHIGMAGSVETVLLDVDGTLVDSSYQHVIAWDQALRARGQTVPLWQVHRHLGMGGDRLVAAICGADVEERAGQAIREREEAIYRELIDDVTALPGARTLLQDLSRTGLTVILTSGASAWEMERYVRLLDAGHLVRAWTTSADVDATKPHPDLLEVALRKAGTRSAVMVGDTTWDCEAAAVAEIPSLGVLTGGISEGNLLKAGAHRVFATLEDLGAHLCKARRSALVTA